MRTILLAAMLLLSGARASESAVRRPTRCCIMVPADAGGERPYCFIVNARPARFGRKICRAIGGRPVPLSAW